MDETGSSVFTVPQLYAAMLFGYLFPSPPSQCMFFVQVRIHPAEDFTPPHLPTLHSLQGGKGSRSSTKSVSFAPGTGSASDRVIPKGSRDVQRCPRYAMYALDFVVQSLFQIQLVVHLTGLAHRLSTVLAQLTPLLSFTGFDLYPFCRCPDSIILLLIQSPYKHVLIAPNIS